MDGLLGTYQIGTVFACLPTEGFAFDVVHKKSEILQEAVFFALRGLDELVRVRGHCLILGAGILVAILAFNFFQFILGREGQGAEQVEHVEVLLVFGVVAFLEVALGVVQVEDEVYDALEDRERGVRKKLVQLSTY